MIKSNGIVMLVYNYIFLVLLLCLKVGVRVVGYNVYWVNEVKFKED